MIKLKKVLVLGAMAMALGATSVTAYAVSNYNTPAEAVAGLTGRTVDSVTAEKTETGKKYGTIANEAGKLTEFKAEILEMKKERLNEKVQAGEMTQEEGDKAIIALEENQENCDGTGTTKMGQKLGLGFKSMNGEGKGQGQGKQGRGQGNCGGFYQGQ